MNMRATLAAAAVMAVLTGAAARGAAAPPPVRAVAEGKGGGLAYVADARGDRVPDFSFAGYAAGAVEIPTAPVRVVVEAREGDQTARVQGAIDYVASLAADEHGVRGAVLLGKGKFEIAGAMRIKTSGVVLRGSGMGDGGTEIVATGQDRRTVITVAGADDRSVEGKGVAIADPYVPVGAARFRVAAGHGLKVGDAVVVRRPCTKEWIHELHMDRLGGDRHGGGWRVGSREVAWERVVTAVDGDRVTIDVPLTVSLDQRFGGGTVAKYGWPGRVRNAGVENLRVESAFDEKKPKDEDHAWIGVEIENAEDAWVRQVTFAHFVAGAVWVMDSGRRVTVEDCKSVAPVSEDAGERRKAFFVGGGQTLVQRCYSEFGRNDFSVGYCAPGPNAFVQCWSDQSIGESGPADSFANGVLFDNVRIDGNELNLTNRWYRAQQCGWGAANSMLWNCTAAVIHCDNPPGATNWAYGCWGEFAGDGEYAGSRESVNPDSLYYGQLAARLGKDVMMRADWLEIPGETTSSPSVAVAAEMAEAAKAVGPRMDVWVDGAARRRPIAVDRAGAKSADEVWAGEVAKPQAAKSVVGVKNGWLVQDGKAVIGGQRGITWWAGGVRPDDVEQAKKKEPNVTRYVPGKVGAGLTDDLGELTSELQHEGDAALRHHYGLWYDTRDADHERVRREDGDVWPPFYEMPFRRSGTGTAWDGLSKYDLTQYNPWYFSRLREFAKLGKSKGVFLIAEHYFQHNILEAGAHWASSPWRAANNVNGTGFPEPPTYAGDKRLFIGNQFYDVSNPARRALHRAFIRENLEALSGCPNVIHMTSAEFTGPVEFVQFWLDTIGEWEGETGKKVLVGLSATKDVQDAILADAKRAAVVDVIDVNYWWYQGNGKAYAPLGGKQLAPRQWARITKAGPATAGSVYRAVREYREKFPEKAVIYSADRAEAFGWAALVGGGSMASVRTAVPEELRTALPSMKVMGDGVLGQEGNCYLAMAEGGKVSVNLPVGAYAVSWIDPKSGKVTAGERVGGGGATELKGTGVAWVTRVKE